VSRTIRWFVPAVLMAGWLLVISSRQVALFPPAVTQASEIVPVWLIGSVVAVSVAARVIRPTLPTHVAVLAASTFGLALLAAQLGQPLANATADYCGDQCRTAIMGRFVAFFGWPILAAIVLRVVARAESRAADEEGAERAAWTRSWALVTLVMGLASAAGWWRIILPDG
jgi:hypothetical protein